MLIFEGFLRLTWQVVATFNEASAASSKKYVVNQGMKNSKSFKNYELIWSHCSIFALY